ncbi:oligosaccharide flippase family protein [Dechloromonas sp. A34]|uniref:oligosaccharide flippase family protein n=1 Tax=Dechloromonas sp. A34 TaxID=447588 RepID=UPI0022494703|nr:oligosaccharide flippase family protein [Dechloromonas sp. A34]
MSGKIFTGAIIVVAMRWTDRLVGLVSTLVLARLLVPDDFGVVAMASIYTGLIDVLLDLGVVAALIHKGKCDSDDYSTAWTVRLLQTALAALIICATAQFVANYYNDQRVTLVLFLMAATTVVGGFENIGIVAFQKDMKFGLDFQFFFLRRIAGFVSTLAFAWYFESYWALPIGALIGRLTGVALSYSMHPLRPRLTLKRFHSIWSLSKWMLIRSIGAYFDSRLDKLIIGGRSDAATIGAYSLADEIAAMPSSELLAPLGRVLFPAFVEARDKPQELQRSFLLALSVQAMIALPAATGLALVADDAVVVLLGERWISAIPFVETLAMIYGVTAISHAAGYLLLTLGKIRSMAIFIWIQVGLFALGALTFFLHSTPLAIAQWRLVVTACSVMGFVAMVVISVETLKAQHILAAVWRPSIATVMMALVLYALPFDDLTPLASLLLRCCLGGASYTVFLIGLWLISGRPTGGESYILGKLMPFIRRQS